MDMPTVKKTSLSVTSYNRISREGFDRGFMKRSYTCGRITQAQSKGWSLLHSMQNSSIMTCCRILAPSGRNDDPAGGVHNNLKMLSAHSVLNIYRTAT